MVKSVLLSVFSAMAVATAGAQDAVQSVTAYIGLSATPSGNVVSGSEGRVISFDLANPSTVTGEYCVLPAQPGYTGMSEDTYIKSGASVGNRYYAYVLSDYDTYSYFASLNFETGTVTKIADTRADYNTSVLDMTYDASTDALYALRTQTQLTGSTSSVLYTVDLADGTLTEYCTLDGVTLSAIASDGQGTIYGVSSVRTGGYFPNYTYTVTLHAIDIAAKTCATVRELGTPSSMVNRNTMAYSDGKLYYAYGRNMMVFEPSGDGFTEVAMPITSGVAGLTLTKSTEDAEQGAQGGDEREDVGLRVTCVETYGDAMGQISTNTVSKRTVTLYDQYNNPVRDIQYGRMVEQIEGASPWQVMYYTKYDYDDEHRLVSRHSEIIQEYVRGEYYYKSNNDTVNYEYDAEGRLYRETTVASGTFTTYEYDAQGQLIEAVTSTPDRFGRNNGNPLLTTVTYSEFAGFNMPRLTKTVSPYTTSWVVTQYDGANHKVKATTYYDEAMLQASTAEYWTWRNDSLVEYTNNYVNSDGTEDPNKRTVYDCVDGDPYRVREASYYYSSGMWRPDGLPKVSYYTQLNETYAPTDFTVTPVEGAINTSTLSFAAPSFPVSNGSVSFDIYRHGILVGSVGITEDGVYDPETGCLSIVDSEVPNGSYDYVVQTVVKDDLTGDSTAYNASSGITVNYCVPLPAVTNVRGELRSSSLEADTVFVAWDAPADLDEALRFEYYNVFVVGAGQANANDGGQIPVTDTRYGVLFAWTSQDIYVQSVYHFGRVNSDTVTINMYELPTGIEAVHQSVADGKMSIAAGRLSIDGVASSIHIYNVSGAVEASHTNVSSIDLTALKPGVHVALVTIDGQTVAVKFKNQK